ncbi:MAG: hypothetical protein GMKNLPBB_03152 [Myxococcota bacterium]|nr:hypothetical protein [Myxococcota bacterium]
MKPTPRCSFCRQHASAQDVKCARRGQLLVPGPSIPDPAPETSANFRRDLAAELLEAAQTLSARGLHAEALPLYWKACITSGMEMGYLRPWLRQVIRRACMTAGAAAAGAPMGQPENTTETPVPAIAWDDSDGAADELTTFVKRKMPEGLSAQERWNFIRENSRLADEVAQRLLDAEYAGLPGRKSAA